MPDMRTSSLCRGCFCRWPRGPESVCRTGAVKIIDTFALYAVLAVQSRRAQIIECAVEFGFNRGVNELDMGKGAGALGVCAASTKWRPFAARSHVFGGCRRSNATSAGAGARCSVLDPCL